MMKRLFRPPLAPPNLGGEEITLEDLEELHFLANDLAQEQVGET